MARDTTDNRPIESVDELVAWLAEGCKPRDKWRIGTEHEKFPFYVDGNAPVPYGGERGIRALLEGMQGTLGWDPIMDAGRIIGLVEPTGQGAISLEPGNQMRGTPLGVGRARRRRGRGSKRRKASGRDTPLRGTERLGRGLRGRGEATTKPRAATMTSRRAAASAGRRRRRIVR
jgi:hypothetical protein